MTEDWRVRRDEGPAKDIRDLAVAAGKDNTYVGTVYEHTDGDTLKVLAVEPFFGVPVVLSIRIAGINCPDRGEGGYAVVNAALAGWLPIGRVVTLTGLKPDKFAGRADAAVATADGTSVAGWLIDHGYAVLWDGVGRRPLVPWPPPAV